MSQLPDVRCPKCNRLLLRGEIRGEISCGKCGMVIVFNLEKTILSTTNAK